MGPAISAMLSANQGLAVVTLNQSDPQLSTWTFLDGDPFVAWPDSDNPMELVSAYTMASIASLTRTMNSPYIVWAYDLGTRQKTLSSNCQVVDFENQSINAGRVDLTVRELSAEYWVQQQIDSIQFNVEQTLWLNKDFYQTLSGADAYSPHLLQQRSPIDGQMTEVMWKFRIGDELADDENPITDFSG